MGMVERRTILAVTTKKSHLVFPVAQFNSSQLIPEVSQVNAVFEHCSIDGVAPGGALVGSLAALVVLMRM